MIFEPIFYTPVVLILCLAVGLFNIYEDWAHPKCEMCGQRKGHSEYAPCGRRHD